MRMTTLNMKKWLVAGMCLFSLSASAQYKATVEQDANKDYSQALATFKLSDVAQTLGTDTATLNKELNLWKQIGSLKTDSTMFMVVEDGVNNGQYTGNYGEFWLSGTGKAVSYGKGSWFAGTSWDVLKDELSVYVGQFPDSLNDGGTVHGDFVLVYGGKQATFDITLQVAKLPDAPAAELQISKLDVVGEAAVEATQYPRSGFATDPVYVKIADAAEKLGTDKKTLSRIMTNLVYQPKINETYGLLADSVVIATTNDGWSRRALSESGDTLKACGNAPYDKQDVIFVQAFKYDADNDTLSANLGQYPGVLKANEEVYADFYIIYGSKAYKVTYTLKTIEAPYHGVEDMTNVGDTVVTVSHEQDNNYAVISVKPNVEAIAAALGTTSDNLSMQAMDSNNSLSSSATANNGGYWLTKGGIITGWGTGAAFFVEPTAANNYADLHVGQYPDALVPGDTARVVLYFVHGEKYYTLHLNYAVEKTKELDPDEMESVAVRNGVVQQLVTAGYVWSSDDNSGTTYTIPVAQINELLGTTEPAFYALEQDTAIAAGNPKYTKRYTCTPNPGFWCSADGKNMGWKSVEASPWGITYAVSGDNAVIRCMEFAGASKLGNTYKGQFFLVNEATKKMVTINLTYQIVSSLETVEQVGEASVTLPVSMDDNMTKFDFASVAKALNVADVNTLFTGGYYLKGLQENGLYTEGVDPVGAGMMFDRQGYANTLGVFGFNINADDQSFNTYSNEEIEKGFKANATICFEVEGKRYTLHLTFVNAEDLAAGVKGIEATRNDGKTYDLSGREVTVPTKGVYIRNGKKFVVK